MSDYQGNIIIKNPATPTGPAATGRAPGMWKLNEVAYWIKQGVWPNANIVPDPYFPYVSLLLSTTSLGNANNNLFVDSSGAFNPISRNGNATQGSFTPYATNWSNYTSGGYLSWTNSTGLGSNNFTIEFWGLDIAGSGNWGVFSIGATSGVDYAGITLAQNAGVYISTTGSSWQYTNIGGLTFSSDGQWHHYAIVRNGGSLLTFKDGTLIATTSISGSLANNSGHCRVASKSDASGTMTGYISNFRVVNGTALYTASFTVPTAPLTAVTNTAVLTCQSNRFRDASSNNFAITVNGSMSVTDFGPFSPAYPGAVYNQSDITNWSGYFDGSGDYLSFPSDTSFALGTGDFTIEAWVYTSDTSFMLFASQTNGGVGFGYNVDTGSQGLWLGRVGQGPDATSGVQLTYNQWNHIAVTRQSNSVKFFVNGTQSGSTQTVTTNYGTSAQAFYIGRDLGPSFDFAGYASNARLVKGTAVYTGNFTPTTTNLTAISGTSLLTLQNAAFTDNSTNNFVITPNGNVTVTGNSPFNTVGYWSNYFDGSGDWLTIPNNAAFSYGTGDFTMEVWVYKTATSGDRAVVDSYTLGSGGGTFGFLINDTQIVGYQTNVASYTFTYTVPISSWTHIAFVRTGGNLTCYVNGTSIGSQANTTNFVSASTIDIGRNAGSGGSQWIGYLSNLRVVKGTAVYTSNFTVPTTPLTAISGTSLLTCQASRIIDSSTNAFTITRNGDVSVQSFDPFYTSTIASNGGSMYFDGSGDYLALQNNPSYALGPGDFTLEVWVYPIVQGGHGSSNNDCIIDFRPGSNGAYGTLYSVNNGTSINWYANTGVRITGAAIPNNSWSHLCVSRVSGNTRLFINGVQSGSTYVDSTNYLQTDPWIGQFHDGVGSGWFQGYMSGMRIVKGSGVSSTFTPPTAPQTPTAATTLLLNGMNAGIYDSATINDMETVGDVKVRNFTPGNYYAGSFDGSGDYLSTGVVAALGLGTSDFTFECWVNPTAYPNDCFLVGIGSTPTGNEVSLQIRNGQVSSHLYISGSHSDVQFTDLPVTLNTWSHLAISRVSGVLYGFLNGVRSSVAPALTANFSTSALASVAAADRFAGSLSNARITKNSAVYSTATYTVPTSPLMPTTNTAFLTCQNTTFIDNSFNALPITVYGGATAGVAGPFTYTSGASAFFDGSGDYLAIRSTPELAFGTGDFTVEAWMYVTASSGDWFIISSIGSGGFFFGQRAGSGLGYGRTAVAWDYNSGVNPTVGAWQHIAISRSGTNIRIFLSGSQIGTTQSSSTDYTLATGGTSIGSQGANYYLNGALRDVRVTKGVARYTSNFTPPTTSFPTY